MATTSISVEQYLRTAYEPDAEYVDGVIEERNMGEWWHGAWQLGIGSFFYTKSREWSIRVRTEQRIRVNERRYRVPDIGIWDADTPPDPVAVKAPLIAFEVLSREDRIPRMLVRLEDFAQMGVHEIYIVDPEDSALMSFKDGALRNANEIRLREKVIFWQDIVTTVL